ncbi:aspartic proteinase CDR1-like [Silene latifolia]|uniref:aspartic proteinase CDR1-like n=1 Tax=Silene latifolia TaxID=37657 RepID=UPI003D76C5B3
MFFILLTINLINSVNRVFSYALPNKDPSLSFSAPLIHRSSPESPFYNRNYTRENHIEDGILNTKARMQYFGQIKDVDKAYVAAPLSGWNMLMKYTMGTPPVTSYGVFDTGSSFTWVQCQPCVHCYKQGKYPVFNPNKSSSFQVVLCNEPRCSMAPEHSCRSSNINDLCLYSVTYTDNLISSRGVLATETITLSADNTTRTVSHVVFGCGHDNHDRRKSPGIVGLGNSSISLIHQLSVSLFSHYVIANSSHIEGVAYFGTLDNNSVVTGMTTPLLPSQHGIYYLNLTGISVDGSNLDFPPDIFEKSLDGTASGFIIDSGTTYTTLRAEAFDMMVSAIMEVMHRHIPESTKHFELCYKDVNDAPEVVFRFYGLDYVICDANLWVRHQGLYCLAIIRLNENQGNVSVLGFHQQRNVQVGFDLANNLLSLMYPQGCPPDAIDFLEFGAKDSIL